MSSTDESAGGPARRAVERPSERGATAVEYALMVTMIALVIIGAVTVFGQNVVPLFGVPASVF